MNLSESASQGIFQAMNGEEHEYLRWVFGFITAGYAVIATFLGGIVWRKTHSTERLALDQKKDIEQLQRDGAAAKDEIREIKKVIEKFTAVELDVKYIKRDLGQIARSMANVERYIMSRQADRIKELESQVSENEESQDSFDR